MTTATKTQSIADPLGETDSGPPFVFGFGFKGDDAVEMRWEEVAEAKSQYDWIWLHLNSNNDDARAWIGGQPDIPFSAANALLAGETRPRVTALEKGLVVNLRGVNLNEGAEPEDMVSIRIWAEPGRVITTRRRRLKAAQEIGDEILTGLKIDGPGALVVRLANRLTDRMEPYVQEIEDGVDGLEEAIIQRSEEGLRAQLASTRHSAVMFRRFIAPQRDALSRLSADESRLFDAHAKIELREVADRVTRMTEEIDAARERAMVLQDQLTDQRAEEMNRNMMILSVVAAIFLPLGFLTGLLGVNVGGIPGADNTHAFWIVVAASVLIAGVLLYLFRRRGWL